MLAAYTAITGLWIHQTNSNAVEKVYLIIVTSIGLALLCFKIGLMFKHRHADSVLYPVEGGGAYQLTFHHNLVATAGQFVYLGTGYFGLWVTERRAHIAWWDEPAGTFALLMPSTSLTTNAVIRAREKKKLFVDGPHNTSLNLKNFSIVILVARHYRIAGVISYLKMVFDNAQKGLFNARRITLVWELQTFEDEYWIRSWMQSVLERDKFYVRNPHYICIIM